jgi:hypothetical protein
VNVRRAPPQRYCTQARSSSELEETWTSRQHDRLARPGRRESDRRPPFADHRRVLLVGPDEAWRLQTACVFEEAGYAAHAAGDESQAVAFTPRLLPGVVLLHLEAHETLAVLARLSDGLSTADIQLKWR